jgi:CheY-like chemotaxis protein
MLSIFNDFNRFSFNDFNRFSGFQPNYFIFENDVSICKSNSDTINIVMVDDNIKDINLFAEMLKIEKDVCCYIHKIYSPNNALSEIYNITNYQNIIIDLIVLDLNMPTINGKMLLQELKSNDLTKNIPIIIYSAADCYSELNYLLKHQASALFSKPINVEDFIYFCKQKVN